MSPNPPPAPESERPEAIVAAILAGDVDATARLWRREHPAVWKLCLGFLADRHDADDAAQDAMLRLLDQLPRYDARRPFATWRTTVVLNSCRDRLRRDAARERAETGAAEQLAPSPLPAPDDVAARREIGELVTRSLRHLSPREREVFVLHDLEGEATAAVAAALELAESTVRVLLMTARRRLREKLAPSLAFGAAARTRSAS